MKEIFSTNNTFIRVVVSILAIPIILLVAYLGEIYFLLFALLIGLVSFYEFASFSRQKGSNPLLKEGLVGVAVIMLNAYFHFIGYFELILLLVIGTLITELYRNKGSAILNLGITYLGIFYIGLFSSTMVELREFFIDDYAQGGLLIIAILITIWICDSAAFFGGLSYGKHKLFTRVSPKKSWEGAIFGFAFSVFSMIGAKLLFLGFLTWVDIIVVGLVIGTVGQIGDLVESLMKRDAGVKDSSALIPGHGGIFDRFDSLLVSAPVVYLYFKFLAGLVG